MPVEATGPTIPKLQLKLFRIKKQKKALMLVASRLQNFMPNQFSCVSKGCASNAAENVLGSIPRTALFVLLSKFHGSSRSLRLIGPTWVNKLEFQRKIS